MFSFPIGLYDADHGYDNTGSSQNVSIPSKGEPLTVLATPIFIIKYRRAFSYEFL